MIFLRVLPKIFLLPHYSGPPGARGPRFIEPPEPPVPTPLSIQYRAYRTVPLSTLEHPTSSVRSLQSLMPSQRYSIGTQSALTQRKLCGRQPAE